MPDTMQTKLIERKGVNLQEFLSKIEIQKGASSKKPIPSAILEKKKVVIPNGVGKKFPQKHSENSEKLEENLFKFINAGRIVEKDKLLSFVKWFGIPKDIRRIKTQSEFATSFGVSMDTLTSWKKLSGFYNEVEIYHFNEMKRFMADVGYGIVKSAKNGNPKAQELFFKIYMKWNEKLKIEDTTPQRVITGEEKAKIDHALKNIGLASIIKNNKENED